MTTPQDAALARDLRRLAHQLDRGIVAQAMKASRHQLADGYPSSTLNTDGGTSGGTPGSLTERAALQQPTRPLHKRLRGELDRLSTSTHQIAHLIAQALYRLPQEGRSQHLAWCANPNCDEPLAGVDIIDGRCTPCGVQVTASARHITPGPRFCAANCRDYGPHTERQQR